MKALIVLVAVLAGVWLWQRGRRLGAAPAARRQPAPMLPMVRCRQCGVHVPEGEATLGARGAYCSLEHRRAAEGT